MSKSLLKTCDQIEYSMMYVQIILKMFIFDNTTTEKILPAGNKFKRGVFRTRSNIQDYFHRNK